MSNDSSSGPRLSADLPGGPAVLPSSPAALGARALPAGPNDYQRWPWGPAAGFFVTACAFLLSQLLAGGVFMLLFTILGWSSARSNDWFNSVTGQFLAVLVSEALALIFLVLFLRRRKAPWRLLGYTRSPLLKDFGRAAVGFVIYFTSLLVIGGIAAAVFHINMDQKQELGFDTVRSIGDKILTFISLVLLPPIVEETLFRGFLFTGFRKKLKLLPAVLITSLLFASPHLAEGGSGVLWMAGIDTFLLSLVLCYLREKTGALWAGIAVHMLKNGVAFAYLYIFVSK